MGDWFEGQEAIYPEKIETVTVLSGFQLNSQTHQGEIARPCCTRYRQTGDKGPQQICTDKVWSALIES